MITKRDRILGCFIGGAIGDALGAPLEFMTLGEIRERWGPMGTSEYIAVGGRSGFITDDTQMTLWTAEGLIRAVNRLQNRGIANPIYVVWRSYLRWLDTQGLPDGWQAAGNEWGDFRNGWLIKEAGLFDVQAPGNTCLSALRSGMPGGIPKDAFPASLRSSSSWASANGSKGCGGVMRVAPVGLVANEPFRMGAEVAALTHGHPTGYLAAGAFARIISELVVGRSLDAALIAADQELVAWPQSEEVLRALRQAGRLAHEQPASAEAVESLGSGWTAEEALAIAVYCSLTARDFRSAVALAANHSGDSDSTAAMTGNILGTLQGRESMPADLIEHLELRDLVERVASDFAAFAEEGSVPDLERYPPN